MSKDKKKKPREVTRRQFLAGTGIVVGGAAIGSAALLAACGGEAETYEQDGIVFAGCKDYKCLGGYWALASHYGEHGPYSDETFDFVTQWNRRIK